MAYSKEALGQLGDEYATVKSKRNELFISFVQYRFQNEEAREYATQGFMRRLNTLLRCLQNVFTVLPPARTDVPTKDELTEAAINIQAFVFNVFGCIDNLAWVWVREKNIRRPNGSDIPRTLIGLTQKCTDVRNTLSQEFQDYLRSLDNWFEGAGEYRDALAHRVPLYIPYVVHKRNEPEFGKLDEQMAQAMKDINVREYDRLEAEQQKLLEFRPEMTHSLSQARNTVPFHPQMLADYGLVVVLGRKMLAELRR